VSCLFYIVQICKKLLLFFGVVGLWFLQGFFAKKVVLTSCFCGEFVVECVVNVVEKQRVFVGRKIGQAFEVYFWPRKTFALRRFHQAAPSRARTSQAGVWHAADTVEGPSLIEWKA
jgi:hypothetical protein